MYLHNSERETGKKIKCNQCDYLAQYPCMLKEHAKVHSEEKSWSCDVPGCDYKSRWKQSMKNHRKLVHEDQGTVWYQCDKCEFRTKYEYVLKKRHSRLHTQLRIPKKFKCDLCDYDAHSSDKLEDHMRKHTGEKKSFHCGIPGCDFVANCKSSVYMHKKVVHWEKTWHKCDQCAYQTFDKSRLTTHLKIHSEEKPFRCTFKGCKFRSTSKGSLYAHRNRHDNEPLEVCWSQDGNQQPQDSQPTLKVARKLKRYPCTHPSCHFVAKAQPDLSKHVQIHDPNRAKSFKCPLCPRLFFTKSCRRMHVRHHTNEKPCQCSYPGCGRRAFYPADLKKHEHMHYQAEKHFICDHPGCSYSATYKYYLMAHSKIHDPERKREFGCGLCSKSYKTSGGLKTHVFSHTQEKPFKCSTCGYASIHSNLLKKHRCPEKLKNNQRKVADSIINMVTPKAHLLKNGLWRCNFCDFTSKSKRGIAVYAGSAHKIKRDAVHSSKPAKKA